MFHKAKDKLRAIACVLKGHKLGMLLYENEAVTVRFCSRCGNFHVAVSTRFLTIQGASSLAQGAIEDSLCKEMARELEQRIEDDILEGVPDDQA